MRKESPCLPWAVASALTLHALVYFVAASFTKASVFKKTAETEPLVFVWVTVVPQKDEATDVVSKSVGASTSASSKKKVPVPLGVPLSRDAQSSVPLADLGSFESLGAAPPEMETSPEKIGLKGEGEEKAAIDSAREPETNTPISLDERLFAGKALASACPPPFEIPESLRGQGLFPRLYEVTLAAPAVGASTENAQWKVVSFRPKERPLAFVDASLERLVRMRCRFLTSALLDGLGPKLAALIAGGAPSGVSFLIEFY
ncbi:MAG: hypothetical protein IOD12_06725 [Silvanigrellales bacterium]|nr:hypothetical protein [Silvanigrellales bacterium]